MLNLEMSELGTALNRHICYALDLLDMYILTEDQHARISSSKAGAPKVQATNRAAEKKGPGNTDFISHNRVITY